jgi:hypothetical protein
MGYFSSLDGGTGNGSNGFGANTAQNLKEMKRKNAATDLNGSVLK